MRVNRHIVFGNNSTELEVTIRSYSVPENTMKSLFPMDGLIPLKSSSGVRYHAHLPSFRQSSTAGAVSHKIC